MIIRAFPLHIKHMMHQSLRHGLRQRGDCKGQDVEYLGGLLKALDEVVGFVT